MALLASLSNRIFLASAALALVTIGSAIFVVGARVSREAQAEMERGLIESAALVGQQQAALSNQFFLLARFVADLPKFKAAVETGDPPTIQPLAEDYRQQLGADLLLVTGRDGHVLFATADAKPPEGLPTVATALGGRPAAAFWPDERGILQVCSVPVSIGVDTPELLGTLTVGFLLDHRRAEQFRRATASDVAFVLDGRVRAATLPAAVDDTIDARTSASDVTVTRIGDEEFVQLAVPLSLPPRIAVPSRELPIALVLRSRTSQLRALRTVNRTLLATAGISVLLATVLAYVVARSVTRPLGTITATMREMATTGDLTRKIELKGPEAWQDEDARLLASTFNSLTDSIARFQREASERQRLLSLGRLSTVIAHEVRNPLMIIKAALRSLTPGAPADDVREAVTYIDDQVNRLNRIVHDVLDFSRPLRFEIADTDLAAVCRDAAAAVTAGNEGAAVDIRVQADHLPIRTDAERLRAALVNVVTNARQAAVAAGHGNGGPGVVVAASRIGDGRARVSVSDSGGGIPPEQLMHVFEPYFTTRRAGTGLGLPIARNIVEGLGGAIRIESGGSGTTVVIEIPDGGPEPAPAPV
jgi:signal transduction histidine kinase